MEKRWKLCLILGILLVFAFPCPGQAKTTPAQAAYDLVEKGYAQVDLRPQTPLQPYMDEVAKLVSCLDPFESHLVFYRQEGEERRFQAVLTYPSGIGDRKEDTYAEVEAWKAGLPDMMTDRQKAQAVNAELIRRVTYDESTFAHYRAGLPMNDRVFSADGALLDGVAVCEGFAGAALLMSRALDLPCIKVFGEAQGLNHAWNRVYLREEGRWLNLDVTINAYRSGGDPDKISLQPAFLVTDHDFAQLGMTWISSLRDTTTVLSYPAVVPQALKALVGAGLVRGYGNGGYGEDRPLTRQELATLLVRLHHGQDLETKGVSGFPDVDPWAESVVAYCRAHDLLFGYPDGTFRGQAPVSKQEWAAVILRLYDPERARAWARVEDEAEALGLVHPGRRSGIWGQEALRADVFDSLYRSRDLIGLDL